MSNEVVATILDAVKDISVISKEDRDFLVEKKEHLNKVMECTHMWRTDAQKLSIISDSYHPTLHSKFHQSILEQKVQFDQSMYLAKDFELKKLEIEELECDLSELGSSKRDEITRKKILIEMQFKKYELKNMQIAMKYRIDEVKGWQAIEERLLEKMEEAGLDEKQIWSKGAGDIASMFFQSLTNLHGIRVTKDGAERNNLVALAKFSVVQAKDENIFETLKECCNGEQLEALKMLESL